MSGKPHEPAVVSFVMPAWRPEPAWLCEAVSSVLGETVDLELIVVDDGNAEPVAHLLGGIRDRRLDVIRIPHSGVSAARNAGMAAATGQWVRFVDADDVVVRGSTAVLLELAAREKLIAYGATEVCDDVLRPIRALSCRLRGRIERETLLGRFTVRLPALLFPREVVDAVGPWATQMGIGEDADFCLRAVELAPVRGTSAIVTRYRRHGASATAATPPVAAQAPAKVVFDRWVERHPDAVGSRLYRHAEIFLALQDAVRCSSGSALRDRRFLTLVARHPLLARPLFLDQLQRSRPGRAARRLVRHRRPAG